MVDRNEALARYVREARCSMAGLARRINQLGAAEGLSLTYDYTSVGRWLKRGEQPRPPAPVLLARVLSELLGRTVTPGDLGLAGTETLAAKALDYPANPMVTVDTVLDLGRAELKRRNVIAAPFALAALAAPSRDWLIAALAETTGAPGPPAVDKGQVDSIRHMFRLFQEMDVMRGGGHARVALVEYLSGVVLPLVKRGHPAEVQKSLLHAASEQTYLVGWMAYDDGQHGLAERYLIQSLRLAQESGDRALGAHVLAGMSDQANLLGHPREALALARAGQRGITVDESPACLADLQILEARALAALREGPAASRAVARAEATFARVVPENEAEWARFIDAAYLFGEAGHCFRDLGDSQQIRRFAGDSAAHAQSQRRGRRGALSNAVLAIGHLLDDDVDAAAARGIRVLDLAASVSSTRCRDVVRDLVRRLEPHRQASYVKDFTVRAQAFLTSAA